MVVASTSNALFGQSSARWRIRSTVENVTVALTTTTKRESQNAPRPGRRLKTGNGGASWTETGHIRTPIPTDESVAAKLGRSSVSVKAQRLLAGLPAIIELSWTQEDDAMLGRFTDAEIARRTGRSNSAVWLRRKQLGIPPVPKANYRPWTTAEIALLGTMPDKEFAARFGHSVGSTKAKRLALGIGAFQR